MKFIVFHGAYGSPEGNWFPELKEKLEALGQKVIAPKFPVENWDEINNAGPETKPGNQSLENWLKVFGRVAGTIKKNDKLCFIGHSLGSLFILHIVDKYDLQLDSAIFVSPFLKPLQAWQFDIPNSTFYKTDFDWKKLRKLIPNSYALYSDNDPYVDKTYSLEFAENLRSSAIFVKKAGHMNAEVNLNEFPLVYELCKTRLDITLYQRYLEHKRELFTVPYIKGKSEEVVYIDPKDVFAEGVFHFRNLRKEGFCTFFTSLRFWSVQSRYMQEARKAAKRLGFTRVFIVDKLIDLKRKPLLKQIRLDAESGIKAYLCMWSDVKKIVREPDFGIWDNEYVCTVRANKDKKVSGVELNSRKICLKEAAKWKNIILRKATRIYNADEDIEKFAKMHN